MYKSLLIAGLLLAAAMPVAAGEEKTVGKPDGKTEANTPKAGSSALSIYDFAVTDIDGKDVPLSKYKNQVCLVVNMASQ